MDNSIIRRSKFLSTVLRHRPESIGLSLDQSGWTSVDELLVKVKQAGMHLSKASLMEVVEQDTKRRFSISNDGLFIRANQGHSIPVKLDLNPVEPPQFLFHGTAVHLVEAINRNGLIPMGRNHVHLTADKQEATKVGKRHGHPIVLTIRASRMHALGFQFYRSANGVWLSEQVPASYILTPENNSSKEP